MSKRKDYWSRMVSELELSGLNRAEFCRRRGLNYQTMSWWVKRLADAATADGEWLDDESLADDRSLPFAELPMAIGAATGYEIVLSSGRSIRIGSTFDTGALTQLIQVVEGC